MPESGDLGDTPAGSGDPTTEIDLPDDAEQAGSAEADLTLLSEQRAMQELHRFQKLSQALEQPNDPPAPPPIAPPISL